MAQTPGTPSCYGEGGGLPAPGRAGQTPGTPSQQCTPQKAVRKAENNGAAHSIGGKYPPGMFVGGKAKKENQVREGAE